MKKRDKTRGRKKSRFRGDLWILLIMGFLLLWVVLAHEFEGYKKIGGEIGKWEDREMLEQRTAGDIFDIKTP